MNSTSPADKLVETWADPQIRRLARRITGNAEAASDALQNACMAILRHPSLEDIKNMRAYFITVLRRQVAHVQGPPSEIPVADFDERQRSSSFEGRACSTLDARARYERFMTQRDRLLRAVPARSDDPGRYRAVIGDVAEQILRASVSGEPSEADLPTALRAAYREYFAGPGVPANTCDQRAHRARQDVRGLLKAVVSRAELSGN